MVHARAVLLRLVLLILQPVLGNWLALGLCISHAAGARGGVCGCAPLHVVRVWFAEPII